MLVEFKTDRLRKLCETARLGNQEWGPPVMRKVVRRLNELCAARNLADLNNLASGARPHPLRANFEGQYAVDLHGGYRMRFEPTNPPGEYITPNGMDVRKITAIRILAVEDYHG